MLLPLLVRGGSFLDMASNGFVEHVGSFWQLFTEGTPVISPLHHQHLAMQTQYSSYYVQQFINKKYNSSSLSNTKFMCDMHFFENGTFYFHILKLILV